MKFLIEKSELAKALEKVIGITSRPSNMKVTAGVLIKAETGGIIISATDLETGFRGAYVARVDTEGSVVLDAKKIKAITKGFPGDKIQIDEPKKQWVSITGDGNTEYHIVGMNPEDFPDIPQTEDAALFDIFSSDFKRMLEQAMVITAIDKQDRRAHINGVLFETSEVEGNKIVRIVSTDGSRLSISECVQASETPVGLSVLIPKKGVSEIISFLKNSATVQIGIAENKFIVKQDAEILIIRLLEGDFPKYADIIAPPDGAVPMRIDRAAIIASLRRMSILSTEGYKGVKFEFQSGQVIISAKNPDLGESKETLEIPFDGNPFEVAFNPKYFIGCLSVIGDETVLITLIDERRQCLIKGEADTSYQCVIMPMRT